jgi:hypothetical protein
MVVARRQCTVEEYHRMRDAGDSQQAIATPE